MKIGGRGFVDDDIVFSLAKGCDCAGGLTKDAAIADAAGDLVEFRWGDLNVSGSELVQIAIQQYFDQQSQNGGCICFQVVYGQTPIGDKPQTAMMPEVSGLASQPKFDCVKYIEPLGAPCPEGVTCFNTMAECLLACGCDCAGDCPSSSSSCDNIGCEVKGMLLGGAGFMPEYELSALSITIKPNWTGMCPSMDDMPDCSKRGGYVVKGPTKGSGGIQLGGEYANVTNTCGSSAAKDKWGTTLVYPMTLCPRIDCVESEDPNNPGESAGGGVLKSTEYTGFEIIDNRSAGGCSGPRGCADPPPIFCDCWPLGRGPNDPSSSTSGTIVLDPNGGGEMAGSKDTRLRIYCHDDPEGLDCLATCSPSSTSGDGDSGGGTDYLSKDPNVEDVYWCVREQPGSFELPTSLLSPTNPDVDIDNWRFLSPIFAYGPSPNGAAIWGGEPDNLPSFDELFPGANPDDVKWYMEATELDESDPGDGFVVSVADPCPSYNDSNVAPCSPSGPVKRYRLSAFRGSYTENQSRFRNTPAYPGAPFMPWWRGNYVVGTGPGRFANAFVNARWEEHPDEKVPGTPAKFPNLRDGGSRTESGEFCAKGGDTTPYIWYGETGLLPSWLEIIGGPYYVDKYAYPTAACGSCGESGQTSSGSSGGQTSSGSSGGQTSSGSSGGQTSSGSSGGQTSSSSSGGAGGSSGSSPIGQSSSSSSNFLYDPNKLVLVYDTSKEPANNTISLPLAGTVNATVNWGDGTTSVYSTTGFKSHTYAQPGVYVVQVSGTLTSLDHGTGASTTSNKLKLVRCLSFGNIGLTSMLRGFRGCANLAEVPSSLPSAVTNASEMFRDCAVFNDTKVSSWNTTALQNTSGMFVNCTSFNRDLSSWNTSNVTNMANMFYNCPAFTSNLSAWNTGLTTSMTNMFYGAAVYTSNMGSWNLAGLNANTRLDNFMSPSDALSTDNYDATLVGWNNNKASFRNDLRPNFGNSKYTCGSSAATARASLVAYGWTVTDGGCVPPSSSSSSSGAAQETSSSSSSSDGSSSFTPSSSSNSSGAVQATSSSSSSSGAAQETSSSSSSSDGGSSDSSSVSISGLVPPLVSASGYALSLFNLNDETCNIQIDYSLDGGASWVSLFPVLFEVSANSASPTFNLSHPPSATTIYRARAAGIGQGNSVSEWSWKPSPTASSGSSGSGQATSSSSGSGSAPDASSSSSSFPHDPSKLTLVYDTSKEPANNTVSLPLAGTVGVVVNWGDGTSNSYSTTGFKTHTYAVPGVYVVQVDGTLTSLDHGVGDYTTSNKSKLVRCLSFGAVGLVNLTRAFRGCSNLVQVPSSLPVTANNAAEAFRDCTSLMGSELVGWDTSRLTNMSGMFVNCSGLNANLSGWDTALVTNMGNMFYNCPAFNSNLSSWSVGSVTNMSNMFYSANAYTSDMGGWNLEGLNANIRMDNFMASAAGLSTNDYNGTLIGWNANKSLFRNDLRPNFGGSKYAPGGAAAAARAALVAYGWTITDGGSA